MKRFIIQIFIISFLYFLLQFFILDRLGINHRFQPNERYYNFEFNEAFKEKNAELIALGNSKLLSSIDKKIIEEELKLKTAILGYSSSNLSVSRLTLESYLYKCTSKPKIVLLEVSWFTFNKDRTTLHMITGDLVLKNPFLVKYLFRYSPKFWYNLTETIKLKQQNTNQADSLNTDYSSRFREENILIKDYTFNKKNFEKVFPTHNAGIEDILLEDLYKIVELCKENDIQLILYTSAEGEEYTLLQKDRAKIKAIFYDLAASEEQVMYLDYTMGGKYYDKQFELWLQDSHHIGANDLFTKILVDDIKKNSVD